MSTHSPEGASPSAKRPWWAALRNPKEIRKALVFIVTVTGFLLAQNLIHGNAERWAEVGLGVAGLLGIYATPNQQGIPGTYVPGEPPAPGPTAKRG